jgi:hypothetical protein
LRDASGITCRFERAAKDGRTGTTHHGWLLAESSRREHPRSYDTTLLYPALKTG